MLAKAGVGGLPGLAVGFAGWRLSKRIRSHLKEKAAGGQQETDPFSKPSPQSDGKNCSKCETQAKLLQQQLNSCQVALRDSRQRVADCEQNNQAEPALLAEISDLKDQIRILKFQSTASDDDAHYAEVQRLQDILATQPDNSADHEREIDDLKDQLSICKFEQSAPDPTLTLKLERVQQENLSLQSTVERLGREVKTRTEYVHVPTTNHEAEAYKEALRRVGQMYPEGTPYLVQVEDVAEQILHRKRSTNFDKPNPMKEN